MHADVDTDIDHNAVQDQIQALLKVKFNIAHATVQLECGRCSTNTC